MVFSEMRWGYMRSGRRDGCQRYGKRTGVTLTNGAGDFKDGKVHSGKHGTYGAA